MGSVHIDEIHLIERQFSETFATAAPMDLDPVRRVRGDVACKSFPEGGPLSGLVFHGPFPSVDTSDRAFWAGQDVVEEPACASAFERADLKELEVRLTGVGRKVPLETRDIAGEPIDGKGGRHGDVRRSHVFGRKGRRNNSRTFRCVAFVLMMRSEKGRGRVKVLVLPGVLR